MSFTAQVFRVLIASPSDVEQERNMAVRVIQEWNDLNASERQLVLMPLRWETHSSPEYGKRPQETINRQVVDHCDLLIGIFWTRIGSHTGVADSGTIEEIERVAGSGKPAMLYFSQAKHDPDKLDLDQLTKLREFKKKTFPKALIENYIDLVEFKDKLSRQIEIQLRTILAERADSEIGGKSSPVTDIVLHFSDTDSGEDLGASIALNTRHLIFEDFESIPDYRPSKLKGEAGAPNIEDGPFGNLPNQNYYRQMVTSLSLKNFFKPLRFWMKNFGAIGARDVYVDLSFSDPSNSVVLVSKSQLPDSEPSATVRGFFNSQNYPVSSREIIEESSGSWNYQFEIPALQPQRQLSPNFDILIGAKKSCDVKIIAKIFADTIPEPVVQELLIRIEVKDFDLSAIDYINKLKVPVEI